jgi:hypothetical protein
MNLPVALTREGLLVLRPGRSYRLLVCVTGATSLFTLLRALAGAGFDAPSLVASAPANWPEQAPPDWPAEPPWRGAVNETPVRVSAVFAAPGPVRFGADMPIEDGATYTIVAAWECRADPHAQAAGAAQAPAAAPAPAREGHAAALTFAAIAASLLGLGAWQHYRSEKRWQRENRRMRAQLASTEREALERRTADLRAEGLGAEDAEQLALAEMLSSPELQALAALDDGGEAAADAEAPA